MQIFLQQIPTTLLPLWAQIILLVVVAIAIIQQFRHSTALGEFNIVKQANERLRLELKVSNDAVATYKARTDLQPLIELLKESIADNDKWKIESRGHYTGALQRLEEIRAENIQGMHTAQVILNSIAEKLTEKKDAK